MEQGHGGPYRGHICIFITFALRVNASATSSAIIQILQLTKPFFCTIFRQRFRSAIGSAVSLLHFFAASVMADDVAEAFTRNAKVMKMLDTEKYDIAVIKPRELINGTTYKLLGTRTPSTVAKLSVFLLPSVTAP